MCHWRASSLPFMPDGCNVLALVIKCASRDFLTESRLLRMSSIGMRWTSLIEWPAWLKCSKKDYRFTEVKNINQTRSREQFNQRNMGSKNLKFSLSISYLLSKSFFAEIKTQQEKSIISMKIDKIDDNR